MRQRLLQRLDRVRVLGFIEQSCSEIGVAAEALGSQVDDFVKHLGGVVVLGLTKIEGAEQVVTAPIVGAQGDYLLISVFCVLRFAETVVGSCQAHVGVFI